MKSTILDIIYNHKKYPVIEIKSTHDTDIVIRFIHSTVHWTLHKANIKKNEHGIIVGYGKESLEFRNKNEDYIIFTSHDEAKEESSWDEEKVQIAEADGYRNPERHKNYIIHHFLTKVSNIEGYWLGTYHARLLKGQKDSKYLKKSTTIGVSCSQQPFIKVVLSTKNNSYRSSFFSVPSFLGTLFFEIIEN